MMRALPDKTAKRKPPPPPQTPAQIIAAARSDWLYDPDHNSWDNPQ